MKTKSLSCFSWAETRYKTVIILGCPMLLQPTTLCSRVLTMAMSPHLGGEIVETSSTAAVLKVNKTYRISARWLTQPKVRIQRTNQRILFLSLPLEHFSDIKLCGLRSRREKVVQRFVQVAVVKSSWTAEIKPLLQKQQHDEQIQQQQSSQRLIVWQLPRESTIEHGAFQCTLK